MLILRRRWHETWKRLALPEPTDKLFDDLVAHYQETHRRYHTLQHLEECFTALDELRPATENIGEIELALWFHDAIYDVRRRDNEEKSAEWAKIFLDKAGALGKTVQHVQKLILATCHHQPFDDPDVYIVLDVDLSILGATQARFLEYEQQIRAEYQHVPESIFVQRRKEVLEAFMRRKKIFNTRAFFDRFEQQARKNLANALCELSRRQIHDL